MARINFTVEDHSIRVDNLVELTQGSNNFDVCNFEFDSSWDGYTKYGIFYQNPSEAIKVPLSDNSCNIPAEVLRTAGKLYVGARGVLDGNHVATTQVVSFRIRNGAVDGSTGATEEITASEYEIVMAAVTKANARIDNLIAHNNDTEGNSELVDIRVSADGTVYPSAGEAVRAQVSQLSEEIITPEKTSFIDYDKDTWTETVADFTNQLPISTDIDGHIYNGTGFAEGILNASGGITASSAYNHTGLIPCKSGDVVRGKGVKFTADATKGATFYDSNKDFIKKVNTANLRDALNASDTEFTLTVPTVSNMAYIRISGQNISENTIITVNEEITYLTVTHEGEATNFRMSADIAIPRLDGRVLDAEKAAAQVKVILSGDNTYVYETNSPRWLRYHFLRKSSVDGNYDVTRLNGIRAYTYDGKTFGDYDQIVPEGAIEYVMAAKIANNSFIGGAAHGNEVSVETRKYLDGVELKDDGDYIGRKFILIERTELYDPASGVKIADHYIYNSISPGTGWTVRQKVVWSAAVSLTDQTFLTMFAMCRDMVTDGYRDTDYAQYIIPASGDGTSTGGFFESKSGGKMYALTGKHGGSVRVIERSGGNSNVSYGDNTYSGHVKAYFRFADSAIMVSEGDVWENTAVYGFNADILI